jgi:N-acetylglucosamine-6-phosphate deacetylase
MGEGTIAMITIAPELPGALDAIALLAENSVIPALGHSEASPEEMAAGIHAGGQVVTHFHNAMQKFESGKKTSADYLRHDSSLPLELILDGVHVADEIASDLLKNISERTILVTDAMSAAGCPDGQYTIGALEVEVKDQVARLASNGSLAGSTLTMQRVFFNALSMGISLSDVVAMTSTNAAQLAGLNGYGRIEVGAPADFLLLSGDKKSLKVLEL